MAKTLTAADRSALIRLASTIVKGSEERKAILAGLSKVAGLGPGVDDNEWSRAYLQWFDKTILKAVGQDMDDDMGSLMYHLHHAISGNTGYPRSGRKAAAKALADFERKVLSAMDSWDKQQRSMGVEFHE